MSNFLPPTMLTYYKRMDFYKLFSDLANIVGSIIIIIVTGIIFIALLTALLIKVEDFLFGKSSTHQVENSNNEVANNNDENKEIAIYDENSK